jgi:hypothetical protein
MLTEIWKTLGIEGKKVLALRRRTIKRREEKVEGDEENENKRKRT